MQTRRRAKKHKILISYWNKIIEFQTIKTTFVPEYMQHRYIGYYISSQEKKYSGLYKVFRSRLKDIQDNRVRTIASTIDKLSKYGIYSRDENIELHMVQILAFNKQKQSKITEEKTELDLIVQQIKR